MSDEQLIATPSVFGETGNLLLERELGRGGMGGVYLGRDKMLDRPIAVKIMLPEYGADVEFVNRFKREAQAAAKLIHPNIAQIYAYGIANGMPYIAMELAAGGSLDQLMKNSPAGEIDVTRVLKLCQQVAQALRCASDQGLVHGDVKPENILLDANGNAKLVDFGLAGMKNDTNEVWGTPYYIAPEKVKKEAVDFRADMYSLGGTLYHALTGVAPFEGADAVEVVKKRFEASPRKPSELRKDLSPQIDELVMKMLKLDPKERFPSLEALVKAFDLVLSEGLGEVLLTREPAPAAKAGTPASGKPLLKTGGKRMILKKHGDGASANNSVKGGVKFVAKPHSVAPVTTDLEDEDGEEDGNLGVKVIAVVVSVILIVGGIIGALVWYQRADADSKLKSANEQIVVGYNKACEAILATRDLSRNYELEFARFAERATENCEKFTRELAELLPDFANQIKPAMTKELLDAIASTNQTAAVTNAPINAVASTNAVTNLQVVVATNITANADASVKEPPLAVKDMRELWERAYACQASAIRVGVELRKLIERCQIAEDQSVVPTEEIAKNRGDLSLELTEQYNAIKGSKDVQETQKAIGFIKSKGEKTVKKAINDIRVAKLEQEREEQRQREEAERKRRLEEQEAAHQREIETETAAAKDRFEAIVRDGWLKSLDFKRAIRELERLKEDFKTAEGEIAIKNELRKLEAMKSVVDIFIEHAKEYQFKKGSIKGKKICEINDKEMRLVGEDGSKLRITWQTFYEKYHGNLNELIIRFVEKGRQTIKLSNLKWAEAMSGAALSMRIICADDPAAANRGASIAKSAVAEFPDFLKAAKVMFPDIDFDAANE